MTTYTLSIVVEGKDHASGPLGGVSGALGRIGEIASGILAADVLRKIAGGIMNVGAMAISSTANMQAMEVGLESLVARELRMAAANDQNAATTLSLADALEKAGPQAKNLLKQIEDLSIVSPYEVSTVQDTFRLGMAFGFTSDEAMKFTKGILNVAAGVGAGNEQMGRMAYNFAQIRMQGKVTAVDVRQLAMAGFDLNGALKHIGAQFGVTIKDHEDFNAAIASGKIKWSDFASAFEKYADENFGGASKRMALTLNGLKSTFNDVFFLTLPKVFGPAAEVVTGFLQETLDNFLAFRDSGVLEEWGTKLGNFATGAVDGLKSLTTRFDILRQLLGGGVGADLAIRAAFPELPPQLAEVIGKVATAFQDIGKVGAEQLPVIMGGLDNFKAFWAEHGPGITEAVVKLFGTLVDNGKELVEKIMPFLAEKFNTFSAWFVENGPLIETFLSALGEDLGRLSGIVTGAWDVIEPILSSLFDIVLDLGTLIMQVATEDWSGAWETIKSIAGTAIDGVKEFFTNLAGWVTGWFGTSWEEVTKTWEDNWNTLKEITEKLLGKLKEAIDLKLSEWKQAGRDLVQGFRDGIQEKWDGMVAWFQGLAGGLPAAVKRILNISSPSRVFMDIGENITAGLAKGIEAGADDPVDAVRQVAGDVTRIYTGGGATASTRNNSIVVNVHGAGDPEAVAREIMGLLKAQGVAL